MYHAAAASERAREETNDADIATSADAARRHTSITRRVRDLADKSRSFLSPGAASARDIDRGRLVPASAITL